MTDWTVERLDALPVDTVVGFIDVYTENPRRTTRYADGFDLTIWSESFSGTDVVENAQPGSIHVISVPPAALLSPAALEAATDAFVMETDLAGMIGTEAEAAIRAAIAQVTGEA